MKIFKKHSIELTTKNKIRENKNTKYNCSCQGEKQQRHHKHRINCINFEAKQKIM